VKNEIRYHYSISWRAHIIENEKLYYYPKGRQAVLFDRGTNTATGLSTLHFGSTAQVSSADIDVLTGNVLSNVTVPGAYRRSNVYIEPLASVLQWFLDDLMAMVNPGTSLTRFAGDFIEKNPAAKHLVVNQLKLADLHISDMEVDTYDMDSTLNEIRAMPLNREMVEQMEQKVKSGLIKRQAIRFLHEGYLPDGTKHEFWLNMSNESDGTMRYFGLSAILAILFRSNKVVGIDELESALHPDLMKHFLLQFLINASASQMIVTTHNALLLDDKDILRPDTIWFTQKANDGASSLYSLADFDSKIYRKGGSILNAYKSGRLGAKPDTIHMPVALN
jgi:hypothetical protein